MEFMHTTCGGRIDRKSRTCSRCKKHFNIFSWWLNLTEIRPIPTSRQEAQRATAEALRRKTYRKTAQYAKWADKFPGAGRVASRLPNWPRWARILTTVGIVVGLIFLIQFIRGC